MVKQLSEAIKEQLVVTVDTWKESIHEKDPIRHLLVTEQMFCLKCLKRIRNRESVQGTYFFGVLSVMLRDVQGVGYRGGKSGAQFIAELYKEDNEYSVQSPTSRGEGVEEEELTLWSRLMKDEEDILSGRVIEEGEVAARIIEHIELRHQYWSRLADYFGIENNLVIPTIEL